MAYRLALPTHILVHNVLHVSLLKRYIHDPKHVIHYQSVHVSYVYILIYSKKGDSIQVIVNLLVAGQTVQ